MHANAAHTPVLPRCKAVQEMTTEGLPLNMISGQDMSKPANLDVFLLHFSSFLLVLWTAL